VSDETNERTFFLTIALASPDHHHLLDVDVRLTGTLELHRHRASLGWTTAAVSLADAAVLHRVLVDTLTLVLLDATWNTVSPRASTFAASTTSARLQSATQYDTTEEFNVDSKAEYLALSSARSQKLKKQSSAPLIQYRLRSVKSVRKE